METKWTLCELMDAHEAMDINAEMQEYENKKADQKRRDKGPEKRGRRA